MNTFITSRSNRITVAHSIDIFKEDGIIHVIYLDGAEITVEVKKQMAVAYKEITGGVKHPFLFSSAGRLWITKEAREYAREIEHLQPFLASAMVAETLGFRLMADIYGRIYKPVVLYKVFRTEAEAIMWLNTFIEVK